MIFLCGIISFLYDFYWVRAKVSEDITWLSFINASSKNPRLNIDETDDIEKTWKEISEKIGEDVEVVKKSIGVIKDMYMEVCNMA